MYAVPSACNTFSCPPLLADPAHCSHLSRSVTATRKALIQPALPLDFHQTLHLPHHTSDAAPSPQTAPPTKPAITMEAGVSLPCSFHPSEPLLPLPCTSSHQFSYYPLPHLPATHLLPSAKCAIPVSWLFPGPGGHFYLGMGGGSQAWKMPGCLQGLSCIYLPTLEVVDCIPRTLGLVSGHGGESNEGLGGPRPLRQPSTND